MTDITAAGTFPLADRTVNRMGFGAMQLAGPGVFGPPKDHDAALAVLREAVAADVDHIDTSDFYGPHVTNRLIREALHPYPGDLTIVTKLGAVRGADASWIPALDPADLTQGVHDNLRHLGVSNVTSGQIAEARAIAEVVCVQNHYNLVHRADDALIDALRDEGIAYVPFFPLGGFTPLQSSSLSEVAARLGATPMQIALAWLLHRAPNILLIPGTSSVAHLHENLAAAAITLSGEVLAELDAIGKGSAR
jgi:aryl-alcohol dehydrogenase-like predicted oxidoreductase